MNKTDEKFYKRVKIIDYCRAWIAYLILQYELITCVCMFEPWERIFINGLVLTLFSLVTYSSVVYLPKYLLSLFTYFGQMIEMLQLSFNLS